MTAERCKANSRESAPPTHFPAPLEHQEGVGLKILCLVYEINWGKDGHLFVAKSADCVGCRGEGVSLEESVKDFKEAVESVVMDKDGGLFTEQSSEHFQKKYFEDTVCGWGKDGVFVLSITAREFELFY